MGLGIIEKLIVDLRSQKIKRSFVMINIITTATGRFYRFIRHSPCSLELTYDLMVIYQNSNIYLK